MLTSHMFEEAKKAWETWNLRGFMLLSLTLQVVLIFAAPLRKRTSSSLLLFLVWLAYLLADWAAAFAVGLIAKSQGHKTSLASSSALLPNQQILALWASFLLVHLGGPDTITAYALEDNALWPRHLLGLLFQVFAALYIFYETFSWDELLAPTILVLCSGIVKYAERTRALFLGCLENFKEYNLEKPDPGPNYEKLMDEYSWRKRAMLPVSIGIFAQADTNAEADEYEVDPEEDDLSKCSVVIKHALHFFQIYKGIIVDLIFSFRDRSQSRSFFRKRTATDAFKVIAVELNLLYDVLYTKAMIFKSPWAYVFRVLAFSDIVVAMVLFRRMNKDKFHPSDVKITYCLLFGAIALDGVAAVVYIFSDWAVNVIRKCKERKSSGRNTRFYRYVGWLVISVVDFLKRPATCSCEIRPNKWFLVSNTNILFRRWSETIPTYNLLNHCLREPPRKIRKPMSWWMIVICGIFSMPFLILGSVVSLFGFIGHTVINCLHLGVKIKMISDRLEIVKDFIIHLLKLGRLLEALDRMKYTSSIPHVEEIWEKIFAELIAKSDRAADDMLTVKNICESRGRWILDDPIWENRCTKITKYIHNVEYDESLLLWHIATELCYITDIDDGPEVVIHFREFSKILSDYMMYLLIGQPKMMSAVVGLGQIRYRDTCAEVKRFFKSRVTGSGGGDKLKDASTQLLQVDTSVCPSELKGDKCKSVLFDACTLAKELRKNKHEMWEITFKVWVELLSYAASHCRADTQAQALSKGGELVSFVWLLLIQLGIGEQFQKNQGFARVKLFTVM